MFLNSVVKEIHFSKRRQNSTNPNRALSVPDIVSGPGLPWLPRGTCSPEGKHKTDHLQQHERFDI